MSNPSTGEGAASGAGRDGRRLPSAQTAGGDAGAGRTAIPAETACDWARGGPGHDSGANRGRLGALFDIKPSPHAIRGEKNLPYLRKRGRGPSRQPCRAARAAPGIKPAAQSHGVCDRFGRHESAAGALWPPRLGCGKNY